jgi:hypothetical protein
MVYASPFAGPDGSRQPSAKELAPARFQGKHLATTVKKLKGGRLSRHPEHDVGPGLAFAAIFVCFGTVVVFPVRPNAVNDEAHRLNDVAQRLTAKRIARNRRQIRRN